MRKHSYISLTLGLIKGLILLISVPFLFVIVNFFICSERFLVSIGKSDSTLKVNQPQKIENSFCVFTVSM